MATAHHTPQRKVRLDWQGFIKDVYRRNKVLAVTGWIHLTLFTGMLFIAPFDSRTVMGINPWIKPMKFALSIMIYFWTVAWLLEYPQRQSWVKNVLSWGISISMLTEIVCIAAQAARGTTSHYNVGTPLDAAIFATMGNMIALNTLLVVVLLGLFCSGQFSLSRPYLWGIRSGLIIFLAASAVGGVMLVHGAHSVGVRDGGPGLPIVNWSTEGGDLRIPHFLGLHALQLLPILGYLISRQEKWSSRQKTASVLAASVAYAAFIGLLYVQATHGRSFLRM